MFSEHSICMEHSIWYTFSDLGQDLFLLGWNWITLTTTWQKERNLGSWILYGDVLARACLRSRGIPLGRNCCRNLKQKSRRTTSQQQSEDHGATPAFLRQCHVACSAGYRRGMVPRAPPASSAQRASQRRLNDHGPGAATRAERGDRGQPSSDVRTGETGPARSQGAFR